MRRRFPYPSYQRYPEATHITSSVEFSDWSVDDVFPATSAGRLLHMRMANRLYGWLGRLTRLAMVGGSRMKSLMFHV